MLSWGKLCIITMFVTDIMVSCPAFVRESYLIAVETSCHAWPLTGHFCHYSSVGSQTSWRFNVCANAVESLQFVLDHNNVELSLLQRCFTVLLHLKGKVFILLHSPLNG